MCLGGKCLRLVGKGLRHGIENPCLEIERLSLMPESLSATAYPPHLGTKKAHGVSLPWAIWGKKGTLLQSLHECLLLQDKNLWEGNAQNVIVTVVGHDVGGIGREGAINEFVVIRICGNHLHVETLPHGVSSALPRQ